MSYTIVDHTVQFEQGTIQKTSLFLRLFAESVVKLSEKRTPMKTGDLRNRVTKSVLGLRGSIVWNTNYAIYQEEKQFKNYSTPGTGPHFAEDSVKEVADNSIGVMKEAGLL